MKAPDKIFIPQKRLDDNWNQQRCDDVIYIRKEALMEWLQQGFDWVKNPVISVQQIIDKLNSM